MSHIYSIPLTLVTGRHNFCDCHVRRVPRPLAAIEIHPTNLAESWLSDLQDFLSSVSGNSNARVASQHCR